MCSLLICVLRFWMSPMFPLTQVVLMPPALNTGGPSTSSSGEPGTWSVIHRSQFPRTETVVCLVYGVSICFYFNKTHSDPAGTVVNAICKSANTEGNGQTAFILSELQWRVYNQLHIEHPNSRSERTLWFCHTGIHSSVDIWLLLKASLTLLACSKTAKTLIFGKIAWGQEHNTHNNSTSKQSAFHFPLLLVSSASSLPSLLFIIKINTQIYHTLNRHTHTRPAVARCLAGHAIPLMASYTLSLSQKQDGRKR